MLLKKKIFFNPFLNRFNVVLRFETYKNFRVRFFASCHKQMFDMFTWNPRSVPRVICKPSSSPFPTKYWNFLVLKHSIYRTDSFQLKQSQNTIKIESRKRLIAFRKLFNIQIFVFGETIIIIHDARSSFDSQS